MHAFNHACFSDPEDAFTAFTFEPQLLHLLAELLIQRLEFVFGYLSAVTANPVLWLCKPSLLFLQAKYFLALITHHRVLAKAEAEGTSELLHQLGLVCVNCLRLVKSYFQDSCFS